MSLNLIWLCYQQLNKLEQNLLSNQNIEQSFASMPNQYNMPTCSDYNVPRKQVAAMHLRRTKVIKNFWRVKVVSVKLIFLNGSTKPRVNLIFTLPKPTFILTLPPPNPLSDQP